MGSLGITVLPTRVAEPVATIDGETTPLTGQRFHSQ